MLGLSTRNVGDEWLRILDRASSGRPHNGFILEASPLPRPPITQLGPSHMEKRFFTVKLDKQSKEDALVNGDQEQYPYNSDGWRHPLVLYADGVLDEGNLGAIARSAYFLGVDAIVTPIRQSAPWSHIALKASAGAAEAIPIFAVNQAADFLAKSAREGWKIYASDAIAPQKSTPGSSTSSTSETNIVYAHAKSSKPVLDHHPVASHPTILMMGAEGSGLRNTLLNQAHYKIGIRAGRNVAAAGVDSLNVSVAASLLCFEVLKKPVVKEKSADQLF
ncbi:Alpha/beta knot methyltransferase [Lophiotrema nucula]|uniref:Alpha/beta knot methyltransferase n=1 Tax=Lophiotrema nucula TaxID=690887 RepID=A0A6A5Z9Q7_9PLEO|nr:Alpha/beta knot methyltransferase [Lophiotrema nucula]